MTKTVVGSFDTFEHASEVLDVLEKMGVTGKDVNLVANDAVGRFAAGRNEGTATGLPRHGGALGGMRRSPELSEEGADASVASGAGKGAVAGGMIGGTAGLIAGLAGLALPGIGPLVAAGPIAAVLTGAGIGAAAGGLIGGLGQVGVSEADAEYYAEAVRRGGALVIVRAADDRAPRIADTMRDRGAIDIESRVTAWRESGWTAHDPAARPYTVVELERERAGLRGTGAGTMQDTHQKRQDFDGR
jgi:hypothetical protein